MLNLPEELPESAGAKQVLLDGILERGIEKLLAEVKAKGYTEAPFGRMPEPTPLLSEEDFLERGCLEAPAEDDEPRFEFTYGFNPLKFLADYIRWSHPDSVKERRLERIRCVERLQFLAEHAKVQLATSSSLRSTVITQGSGIAWGPVTAAISAGSLTCVMQPLHLGTLFVELAMDAQYRNVFKVQTEEVFAPHDVQPIKVVIGDLKPATRYYIRCYMAGSNSSGDGDGDASLTSKVSGTSEAVGGGSAEDAVGGGSAVDAALHAAEEAHAEVAQPTVQVEEEPIDLFYAQSACVSTLPLCGEEESEDGAAVPEVEQTAVTLVGLPGNLSRASSLSSSAIFDEGFTAACLLGDPFDNHAAQEAEAEYRVDSWSVYCGSRLHNQSTAAGRNAALFLGWNDSRLGSDVDVRSEEVTFKQFQHDLKKHTKKYSKKGTKNPPPPPTHSRPNISRSLEKLVQVFPTTYAEEGAYRSLHRVTKLGPDVELFQLDARGGYLPKSQLKWLKESLGRSAAQWKIVLSGVPVGVVGQELNSVEDTSDQNAGEDAEAQSDKPEGSKAGKSVTVTAPESHKDSKDENELDEQGRPKHSLPGVIASLQRQHERQLAQAKADEQDDEPSDEPSDTPPEDEPIAQAPAEGEVTLDSGIVFLTAAAPTSGSCRVPFVATFDPSGSGSVFCAEVCVGGAVGAGSIEEAPSRVTPHMEASFPFNSDAVLTPSATTTHDHTAIIKLGKTGDLTVRLLRLANSTHPDASTEPTELKHLTFKLASHE